MMPISLLVLVVTAPASPGGGGGDNGGVVVVMPPHVREIPWGVARLQRVVSATSTTTTPITTTTDGFLISVVATSEAAHAALQRHYGAADAATAPMQPEEEGFVLLRSGPRAITVVAQDGVGGMYGLLALSERIAAASGATGRMKLAAAADTIGTAPGHSAAPVNPRFGYRAVKINLPWSPYRPGISTAIQFPGCTNLTFWEALLDHLATSRFNLVSLWAEHPWPYMIRSSSYPKATAFNDTEL